MATSNTLVNRLFIHSEVNQPLLQVEVEHAAMDGDLRVECFLPLVMLRRDEVEQLRDFLNDYLRVS